MRFGVAVLVVLLASGTALAAEPIGFGQHQANGQYPGHGPRMSGPDGTVAGLGSLLGPEPLVVNVWATWCGPCREELPALAALAAWLGPRGGDVVLIAAEQAPAEQVNRFLHQRLGITTLDTYVDRAGEIVAAFRIDYYPTTLILDRNGRVLDTVYGAAAWDGAEARRYLSRWLSDVR